MDDRDWYLVGTAGRRFGPYPREVIDDLLSRNELQPDTLIWHTGLARWQPARRLLSFEPRAADPSPAAKPRATASAAPGPTAARPAATAPRAASPRAAKPPARPKVKAKPAAVALPTVDRSDPATSLHPWLRAGAAAADLLIAALVLSLLSLGDADFRFRPFDGGGRFLWIALWAIGDAVLLSRLGTTPGRKLFGVTITDAQGQSLPPPRAAARSALIAFTVLGGGNLFFGAVLSLVAFRFVSARGHGWWDLATGSRATFEDLPAWRRTFGVLALAALLLLLLALRIDPATLPASITL